MLLNNNRPTLIVIAGPTAVGKTNFCIRLAENLQTEIISADSRQFYKETVIGTAAPTKEEMNGIVHHFIGHLSIHDYYNVSLYEQEALATIDRLFQKYPYIILTGGSGLYIDTLCYGIDNLPDVDIVLRNQLQEKFQNEGIESCLEQLKLLDYEFYQVVDKKNHQRILRALEVCLQTGQKYSLLRSNKKSKRNFNIVRICLTMPREQLNERINQRTDNMMNNGFLEEAQQLLPYKHLNALNTVGYRELFDYLEKKISLEMATDKIKTNTRRYAKRQMTWFKKEGSNYLFLENHTIENVTNILNNKY